MPGFDLLENFIDDPESLLRKRWSCAASSSTTPLTNEPVTLAPSATFVMAKTLHDYSVPTVANVPDGPTINTGVGNFELCTGLITMAWENQFSGLPSEDVNAHLQYFLELCATIVIKDVAPTSMKLHIFPFSLAGKAK